MMVGDDDDDIGAFKCKWVIEYECCCDTDYGDHVKDDDSDDDDDDDDDSDNDGDNLGNDDRG